MKNKLPTTYMVELLYESTPVIDGNALLDELHKRCGKVDRLAAEDHFYLYAFPDLQIHYKDGEMPAQIFLGFPEKNKGPLNLGDALQQSWGWTEAKESVNRCDACLLLTDMMSGGLEYKTRLNLFHNALESVLAVVPCLAIDWIPSQQVINPVTYLESRKSTDFHPLQFALNVRLFRITNSKDEDTLMDTMGLGVFGLPDLQCHFHKLDPNEVARVLYNSAYYIFDKGDIVDDGETIQGVRPNDKWKCQHEKALVGPEREVLDLNPGKPYAAGKR